MGHEMSDRDVATTWMTSIVACDVDAALALSAPTIVYTTGQVRRYEGHDGIHDIVSDFRRMSGFLTITLIDLIEKPGVVALRRLEQYVLPTGTIQMAACSFVDVAGGVVTRWADYKSMQLIDDVAG